MADGHHQPEDVPDFIVDFVCPIKIKSSAQALQCLASNSNATMSLQMWYTRPLTARGTRY